MTAQNNIRDLFNTTAFDNNGDKLGEVQEVFVDDHSGKPTFVEVKHGLFGMSSSLVPLKGHRLQGEDLQLAFDKDRIKDAPNVDADQGLTCSSGVRPWSASTLGASLMRSLSNAS